MTNDRNSPETLATRLSEVEFLFTHLERQVADLNRVVLDQQARLDSLTREVRAMQRSPVAADEAPPEDDE
jgi:uncharacterized coiled-coil protein SlyX